MRTSAPAVVTRTGLWLAAVAALSCALLLGRTWLDKAHIALAYVAVTLAASAFGGRTAGIVAAIGAFAAFDVFFLPPYGTFTVANPADWVVLVAFLATSLLAGQLFHRAEQRRLAESERAAEVERLATLGTEALAAGRAADALAAAASVLLPNVPLHHELASKDVNLLARLDLAHFLERAAAHDADALVYRQLDRLLDDAKVLLLRRAVARLRLLRRLRLGGRVALALLGRLAE